MHPTIVNNEGPIECKPRLFRSARPIEDSPQEAVMVRVSPVANGFTLDGEGFVETITVPEHPH